MNIEDVLKYWPLILAILGLIIWLVRLEGLAKQNTKDLDRMQTQHESLSLRHESLDSKVVEQLAQVREALARIEGYIRANKES